MSDNDLKVEVPVNFLYPDIILKGDAYTPSGVKVWDGNKPIPVDIIENLRKSNVLKIYYTRPAVPKPKISNPMIDDKNLEKGIDIAQELEKAVINKALLPEKQVDEVVDNFLENISQNEGTVLNLLELKDFDDYTYTHSVNVCLLSILFSKKMGYNKKGMKLIGISALLHDIGKTMIPKEILNKPVKLTNEEFEIMKKHSVYSYEIIKSQSTYGPLIQKSTLLHHERYDGKGYPFGLRQERIGDIPQIISLSDMFDAVTSERSYKLAQPYWNALSLIRSESGGKFSPRMTKTFVQDMPKYLTENEIFELGMFVLLNTGEVGEVVGHDTPHTLKPQIKIYINGKRNIVRYPIPVNLEFDDSRYILKVFDDSIMLNKLNLIKSQFVKEEKADKALDITVKEVAEEIKEKEKEENYDDKRPSATDGKKVEGVKVDNDLFKEDEKGLK